MTRSFCCVPVDRNGDQDDEPDNQAVPDGGHTRQHNSVAQHIDEHDTAERSENRTLAAEDRGAPHHHRGDCENGQLAAAGGLYDADPTEVGAGGETEEQPEDDRTDDSHAAHVDARQLGCLEVGTDRIDGAPEGGAAEHDVQHDVDHENEDQEQGDTAEPRSGREEREDRQGEDVFAVPQGEETRLEERACAEGGDDRGDCEPGSEHAVQ
jgi:hypothetical protein